MGKDDWKRQGWKHKYNITKADGTPVDSRDTYFVLHFDTDPHAQNAARAYAQSVASDNPLLAWDILHRLSRAGAHVPAKLLLDLGTVLATRYQSALNRERDSGAEAAKQGGDDAHMP